MKKYSPSFKALWIGEVVSEFGGAAGGIVNGLILFELTGSKEWMGALWLVYFIPSLILQGMSSPFLNEIIKEKMLKNIQLSRACVYLLPLLGYLIGVETVTIIGLIILQCFLGLMQPVYASLAFSLLPDICKEKDLVEANSLLDGTLRLTSFIAPGAASLLLLFVPTPCIYVFSSIMFFASYFFLSRIPLSGEKKAASWTKKRWWNEMKNGYKIFFRYPTLCRLTLLSSTVQFAVGAAMVLSVPYIRGDLNGQPWEYAIFSGSFPAGYALGTLLLRMTPKTSLMMYAGLIGGGVSFVLLSYVRSIPLACVCELFGGMLFPLFNAQSTSIFQREAPRDRLAQLSAVRLLFLRITTPLGILFASSSFFALTTRQMFTIVGLAIASPGLYYLLLSLLKRRRLN